jgi:uncharacterized protein
VLLDESWCEFLKENRFYVGLSLDGPKPMHDHFRKGKQGESSFDRVYRAARLKKGIGRVAVNWFESLAARVLATRPG